MNIINLKNLIMKENLKTLSSSDKMTNEISALSLVESFLDEYYLFRRNVLSGKTEYFTLSKNEDEAEEAVNSLTRLCSLYHNSGCQFYTDSELSSKRLDNLCAAISGFLEYVLMMSAISLNALTECVISRRNIISLYS